MTAAEMDIIVGADVNLAIASFKKLGYTITQTGQTASKFTKKAGTDFTNFNRVIQDLPFGFNAIQNNLTQLIPSAGLAGVAIAAVTTAITFAQVGLSYWTRGLKASKEETDEFAKASAGVATEVTKMSALLAIARDVNESTGARTEAIKQLQKEYPGYLGNLNLENVNSQETANAVDLLSEALARKAKVQALSNLLTAANEKLIKAENATIQENLLSVKAFLGLFKGGGFAAGGVAGAFGGASEALASNIGDAKTEVSGLNAQLTALTQDQARNKDFSLLNPTTPKKLKEAADGFKKIHLSTELIKIPISSINWSEPVRVMNDNIQKELDKQPAIQVPITLPDLSDEAKQKIALITGIVQSGFETIGETLGNVFSGKENPFAPFFEFLGSTLIKLGSFVIASSELLSKITAALNLALKGFGGAGLAVGIGLIALGTIIKNIPKFATGGVVTSPTLAMVGEQGPEKIVPLGYENSARNNWTGEVIFTISGQSLRGILQRANNTAFNTF